MKVIATLLFSCLTGVCGDHGAAATADSYMANMDIYGSGNPAAVRLVSERSLNAPFDGITPSVTRNAHERM